MPDKVKKILDEISKLTLLEAAELVKAMEEKFGVSAAAPLAVAAGVPGGAPAAAAEEEKTEFDVILTSHGDQKIPVVKAVKTITGLGLKEAKDLVDNCPKPVKTAIPKEEAEKIKEELTKVGATVEIK